MPKRGNSQRRGGLAQLCGPGKEEQVVSGSREAGRKGRLKKLRQGGAPHPGGGDQQTVEGNTRYYGRLALGVR